MFPLGAMENCSDKKVNLFGNIHPFDNSTSPDLHLCREIPLTIVVDNDSSETFR